RIGSAWVFLDGFKRLVALLVHTQSQEHVMRMRSPSPPVVSALVALSGMLLASGPDRVAATHPGGDSKTANPAKAANENKKGRVNSGKGPLGVRATGGNGTASETKPSNPKMARTDALMRTLDQEISTKDLPRSFWSLLDYLTARMGEAGKELHFFVN